MAWLDHDDLYGSLISESFVGITTAQTVFSEKRVAELEQALVAARLETSHLREELESLRQELTVARKENEKVTALKTQLYELRMQYDTAASSNTQLVRQNVLLRGGLRDIRRIPLYQFVTTQDTIDTEAVRRLTALTAAQQNKRGPKWRNRPPQFEKVNFTSTTTVVPCMNTMESETVSQSVLDNSQSHECGLVICLVPPLKHLATSACYNFNIPLTAIAAATTSVINRSSVPKNDDISQRSERSSHRGSDDKPRGKRRDKSSKTKSTTRSKSRRVPLDYLGKIDGEEQHGRSREDDSAASRPRASRTTERNPVVRALRESLPNDSVSLRSKPSRVNDRSIKLCAPRESLENRLATSRSRVSNTNHRNIIGSAPRESLETDSAASRPRASRTAGYNTTVPAQRELLENDPTTSRPRASIMSDRKTTLLAPRESRNHDRSRKTDENSTERPKSPPGRDRHLDDEDGGGRKRRRSKSRDRVNAIKYSRRAATPPIVPSNENQMPGPTPSGPVIPAVLTGLEEADDVDGFSLDEESLPPGSPPPDPDLLDTEVPTTLEFEVFPRVTIPYKTCQSPICVTEEFPGSAPVPPNKIQELPETRDDLRQAVKTEHDNLPNITDIVQDNAYTKEGHMDHVISIPSLQDDNDEVEPNESTTRTSPLETFNEVVSVVDCALSEQDSVSESSEQEEVVDGEGLDYREEDAQQEELSEGEASIPTDSSKENHEVEELEEGEVVDDVASGGFLSLSPLKYEDDLMPSPFKRESQLEEIKFEDPSVHRRSVSLRKEPMVPISPPSSITSSDDSKRPRRRSPLPGRREPSSRYARSPPRRPLQERLGERVRQDSVRMLSRRPDSSERERPHRSDDRRDRDVRNSLSDLSRGTEDTLLRHLSPAVRNLLSLPPELLGALSQVTASDRRSPSRERYRPHLPSPPRSGRLSLRNESPPHSSRNKRHSPPPARSRLSTGSRDRRSRHRERS